MRKKYLITGGAGFIGSNLLSYFLDKDVELIVVDNLRSGKAERIPDEVKFLQQDVRDTDRLISSFDGVDAVIHLAAIPSVPYSIDNPAETHDFNVNGLVSVLEAARKSNVKKVIFASSSAIYGDQAKVPTNESSLPAPANPYALHKLIGEKYMRLYAELYDLETVSLRFFNVYGPGMDPKGAYAAVIGRFLEQVSNREALTITGDGEQTRDFVHVTDVCRAIENAVESDLVNGQIINIGGGTETSIVSLAKMIGTDHKFVAARSEIKNSCADIEKAKELLNWSPSITLEAGIKELLRSCR